MFRPAALFIGLRYTRAKHRNHFISFISFASMAGIALGVMVLITVLSVMNGFDREIKQRVFSMVPPLTIGSTTGSIQNWEELKRSVIAPPMISAAAPFVTGQALLTFGGSVQPALVNGILPNEEKTVSAIGQKMVEGQLTQLKAAQFGIVIGEGLANRLGVTLGDKITVMTPQVILSPVGIFPQSKRFTLVGIFKAGGGFGFDMSMGYVHLNDAQKLFGLGQAVSGLHLNLKNVYAAQQVQFQLMQSLSPLAQVSTWADQFGEFFHAVQLEKTMMFLILLLIVAVAAFNLVATLVMVVNDKQTDIAILRTFGATPRLVMSVFIIQGGLVGIFGTLIGVVSGLLLAFNITQLVNWVEHVFNVQFLSSNIYFVNYLPSQVEWVDVLRVSVTSLTLSLLATVYPAWRAAKMDPVESLRYE